MSRFLDLYTEERAIVSLDAMEPYGRGRTCLRLRDNESDEGREAQLNPADMLSLAEALVRLAGAYQWREGQ